MEWVNYIIGVGRIEFKSESVEKELLFWMKISKRFVLDVVKRYVLITKLKELRYEKHEELFMSKVRWIEQKSETSFYKVFAFSKDRVDTALNMNYDNKGVGMTLTGIVDKKNLSKLITEFYLIQLI